MLLADFRRVFFVLDPLDQLRSCGKIKSEHRVPHLSKKTDEQVQTGPLVPLPITSHRQTPSAMTAVTGTVAAAKTQSGCDPTLLLPQRREDCMRALLTHWGGVHMQGFSSTQPPTGEEEEAGNPSMII